MLYKVHVDLFYHNFKGKFNGDEELHNSYSEFIWRNKMNSYKVVVISILCVIIGSLVLCLVTLNEY